MRLLFLRLVSLLMLVIALPGLAQDAPTVTISPESGEVGLAILEIVVDGLDANASYVIEFVLDGMAVYSVDEESDAEGQISFVAGSTAEDAPGIYSVQVIRANRIITTADFELTASAVIEISPQMAAAGDAVVIMVSGLAAFDSVSVQITSANNILIDTVLARASSRGVATLTFSSPPDLAAGDYAVEVFVDGKRLAEAVLTVVEVTDSQVSLLIEPQASEIGSNHTVTVSGLDARETVTFDVMFEGESVYSTEKSADADGIISLDLVTSEDDLPGDYIVTVWRESGNRHSLILTATAQAAAPATSAALIPSDTEIPFVISPDEPVWRFDLSVEMGDSLTLTVDSGDSLDTVMRVLSPEGAEFAYDDDSGPGLDAELSNLVFDRSAAFVLAISAFDDSASGAGTVRVLRNPVRSLDAGDAVVTLNDKIYRDLLVFEAAEDELVTLNLERLAGDVEDLFVTAAVEGMEVMSYSTMGVPDKLPLPFVMPLGGQVVVTLEKVGMDDGISLGVSLERAAP